MLLWRACVKRKAHFLALSATWRLDLHPVFSRALLLARSDSTCHSAMLSGGLSCLSPKHDFWAAQAILSNFHFHNFFFFTKKTTISMVGLCPTLSVSEFETLRTTRLCMDSPHGLRSKANMANCHQQVLRGPVARGHASFGNAKKSTSCRVLKGAR